MFLGFVYEPLPGRIVFARGAVARVADEIDRLGVARVLVIGGGPPGGRVLATVLDRLGGRVAGVVAGVAQHVPEATAERACAQARELGADSVLSIGGGSATGLGKAVAVELNLPLVAVPTTYAGSEMTPVYGITAAGRKQTGRDLRALPRAVIYDPDLFVGMPPRLVAASGMNAMAHCVEAFWAASANPVTSLLAEAGIRALAVALPGVVVDSSDVDAHAQALYGTCLAGTSIAVAGSGIHHRTCHVLGGSWSLPHAETHAVVLPHSVALVAPLAEDAVARVGAALGTHDPARALYDLDVRLGLPTSLADLGMPADGLAEATRMVLEASASDPLPIDVEAVTAMLSNAYSGRPPTAAGGR
ncbi:MAG TPA: maleylacetate reductase [Candidatus Dormibacteraeota bacterium]